MVETCSLLFPGTILDLAKEANLVAYAQATDLGAIAGGQNQVRKKGSSLFLAGNLRLPISEVHHARAFFEFDHEAIDNDSRSK